MAITITNDLIKKGASNRPGTSITPKYITIHNTGNSSKGADADAHSTDIHGAAKARGVSWHYTVDDKKVLNHIPPTERAYHAKSGNENSIGIEICMNSDINFGQACKNAIALCKHLMAEYNIPAKNVVQHNYWTGKNCPQRLREGWQGWNWKKFTGELGYGPVVPDHVSMGTGGGGAFQMPTAADYKGADSFGYQSNLRSSLAGTDQWNDKILKICTEKGINPIFLKCIMATESKGNIKAKNPSGATGLMQIMPSWGYDMNRLQTDADYAISKACDIFKTKAKMNKNIERAQGNGGPESAYNVAHGYIGWGKDPLGGSKSGTYYAQISGMVEGFGMKRTDSVLSAASGSFSGGTGESYTPAQYEAIYEGRKLYGDGGWYDGKAFEGISGVYDKPDFMPPHYYDDDFKQLKHRYLQGEYFMRIGDTRFVVPPTQIKVHEESTITRYSSLRQKQSMKVSTGNSMKTIELSLMFTDHDQINGFKMDGPDGKVYYMDGLRALIAQMKVMPFLPVENEFLNFVHKIYAVAILSANVGVVEGFPGVMKVDLTLIEFDAGMYLNKPTWLYDQHFVWPLFRMHYQSLLNGDTVTGDTLAPFVGDDVLDFWHLDEKALLKYGKEVQDENKKAVVEKDAKAENWEVNSETRQKTWWDYNEKLDNAKGTSLLFTQYKMPPNYQIIDINATFGNTLTPLTPSLTGKPTFQYFGSQDARFNVLIQTQDRNVISAFNELKATVDRLAREYREGFVSSMLRLNNNFVNMIGVKSVLIESIATTTVDNSPDNFYISLTLLSFDETQHGEEKLGHLDTLDLEQALHGKDVNLAKFMAGKTLQTFDNNITQAVAAEMKLNELELYPDLELPTYVEVNAMISQINKWRKKQKLDPLGITKLVGPIGAKYVDPDFYFSYPQMDKMIEDLETALHEPEVKKLALDVAPNLEEFYEQPKLKISSKKFFGAKAVTQIERTQEDGDNLKAAYENLGFSDIDGIQQKWQGLRASITDPKEYTRRFWMKAWSGEGGHWDTTTMDVEDKKDKKYKVGYYAKQSVQASVKELSQADFFKGMLHDMVKYDRTGTMMRAFPTYVFVIIDEGKYVNVRKLWDNYYTYHSISEISVHSDRANPISTAHIKLSNVYGALNNQNKYHYKPKTPGWWDMVETFFDSFFSNVTEREMLERAILYKSIQLMAGARIHIRMGYGSCASQLPPVFNGIITEIDTGDMVSIVAQSFGAELTNEIGAEPGENTSMFEEGLESTELFRYYMTERQSNYTFAWRNSAEPENYQSAYGIEHFGFLRVRDKQGITDLFNSWYWDKEEEINAEDYDIMKNVYSSKSYNKIGTDEEDPSDHTRGDVDLSTITDDDNMEESLAKALKLWPPDEVGTVLEWEAAKPDFDKLNIIKVKKFWPDFQLKEIETRSDAEYVVEEMLKEGTSDAKRKSLLSALFWWAANPKTHSRLSGNNSKWKSAKKDEFKGDIEELFKPVKKKYKGIYDQGVATMNAIANEWGPVSTALAAHTMKTQDKGAGANLVDGILEKIEKDEDNVRMQLEGKAPWDVFRTLERVTPEYVVYPHLHQFGYTLFFGKPWWDVQCGYVLPPVEGKKPEKYGQKISDYVELSKPFSQLHFYTSYGDIIGNNIKAVGTNLATAVIPVFQLGKDDEAYEIIWADYYIRGSFQKTKTIDTSLVQNIPYMPNWMEKLGTGVLNFFDGASKYQNHAVRFAQGVIAETFKDMYEGELVVLGDPSAKPYDLMYIDDFYTKMNGTADMGRVTQLMSVETGYITTINPDLSVVMNPDPTSDSDTWADDSSLASENLFRHSHVALEFSLQAWRVYSVYKIGQFLTTTKNLSVLANMARFVKAHQALQKVVMVATISANSGGKLASVARGAKVVKGALSTFRLNAFRTAATGLAVPGPGWAATAVSVASVFASTVLLTAIDKMFIQKYNNVIKIFPLFYQGRPYVAGINGHKQLIPGWEDNGSGTPIRTDYDNRKKISPQKASTIFKDTKAKDPFNTKESQDDQGQEQNDEKSGTDDTKINGEPAPFLTQIDPSQVKNEMFCYPVMLGKEGKGYAGFMDRVISGFKTARRPKHQGLDISPGGPKKANDYILSYADGEVMYAGRFNPTGYGNVVLIKHTYEYKNGNPFIFYTVYGHMRLDEIKVEQGDKVKAGRTLAYMGNEGGSDGQHLHFEIMLANNPVKAAKVKRGLDSINYVFATGRPNMVLVDPAIYTKEILASNTKLVKYVEYK